MESVDFLINSPKSILMHIPGFQKFIVCFIAGLVCAATFVRIAGRFFLRWISPPVIFTLTALILLIALFYAFKWAFQKNEDVGKASLSMAFWQAVIRYGVAFDLIMFGLQKYFHLQFSMPLGLLDFPFSNLSGQDLTFAYFAHSFGFVIFLGTSQVVGAILLLFSRTKLVGVFVLLPVMINITLLNYFYDMDFGQLIHAIILLVALLYFLFTEYKMLYAFFFKVKSNLPSVNFKNGSTKNILRYSAIFIPVALVATYRFPESNPSLYGRYAVTDLSINGQKINSSLCKDSVLSVVYFDQNGDCIFEYNDQNKRLIGNYRFNEQTKKLSVAWRYPASMHDTLSGSISNLHANASMNINGTMGKQDVEIHLKEEKIK